MSRMIDADALDFSKLLYTICEAQARKIVDEAPTVEPELVRCKDCRYHKTLVFCGRTEDYCKRHESFVKLDDFCSMAQLEDD